MINRKWQQLIRRQQHPRRNTVSKVSGEMIAMLMTKSIRYPGG